MALNNNYLYSIRHLLYKANYSSNRGNLVMKGREFIKNFSKRTIMSNRALNEQSDKWGKEDDRYMLTAKGKAGTWKSQVNDFPKTEFLYGIFPVLLALQSRRRVLVRLYFKDDLNTNNPRIQDIFDLCEKEGIPTQCVPKKIIKRLTSHGSVTQGVCLESSLLKFVPLESLNEIKSKEESKDNLCIYLDRINDPMNFGAILRTACFIGVSHIITGALNCCPITATVSKASSGAAEIQPVYQTDDPVKLVESMKHDNWDVLCSVANDSLQPITRIEDIERKQNRLLIIGNEADGISKQLEAIADHFITISPHASCHQYLQSLNVSVATSLLIHSLKSMNK